jgi:hypothetical protein
VHDTLGFDRVKDAVTARRAEIAGNRRNGGSFTFVGNWQVARDVDWLRLAAKRTFHAHDSLENTIEKPIFTIRQLIWHFSHEKSWSADHAN